MTIVRLKMVLVENPNYWKWKGPSYAFLMPKGSRTFNMLIARNKFAPMGRWVFIQKGKKNANKSY